MELIEAQLDRLVGPTHHFGGLGVGNVASLSHAGNISNPAAAAIEGLDKMRMVASYGVPQFILPPQSRPDITFLKQVGFQVEDDSALEHVGEESPATFSAAMSCSAMWTANAATVSAGVDNRFGTPAMTVANLTASLHRAIEPPATLLELRNAFPHATLLPPLPGGTAMRDEGAANQMRFGNGENQAGLHLFVYGDGEPAPKHFWPRQTLCACQAIARGQGLDPDRTFFVKQNVNAIDAGAFHNDVVAASHHDLLIHHDAAFDDPAGVIAAMEDRYQEIFGTPLRRIVVSESELSLADAVSTYLFNSQIVTPRQCVGTSEAKPVLICPTQVQQHEAANALIQSWIAESGLFSEVQFVDLSQSMSGGGGPACLRLRIPMTEQQLQQTNARFRWTPELDERLRETIQRFYPTQVSLSELAHRDVVTQAKNAQAEIGKLFLSEELRASAQ
ncbi:N-succinylarginine dihydrolase [Novipirellula galeiformis]|uniref:N-succinylarginine dihydrolase n=1 Tax=Novipirellula galeiformis TaxID=2528004 RepID=A0A5C6BE93_9BACT|nr:N-succinylarginine dihydrolase [Novipirellula galeiformis]TWU10052.1 N-succinylarginine dihydrolase [Novipirellula galeiformis]